MQTIPDRNWTPQCKCENEKECSCTMEKRLAGVGAKIDALLERVETVHEEAQRRVNEAAESKKEFANRASSAIADMRHSLRKIGDDVFDLLNAARETSGRATKTLIGKEKAVETTEPSCQVPCVQHVPHLNPSQLPDSKPSDETQPVI